MSHLLSKRERINAIEMIIHEDPGNRGLKSIWEDLEKSNKSDMLYSLYNTSERLFQTSRNILICTGFIIPSVRKPETDGPPGALAIARALTALGKRVSLITAPGNASLLQTMITKEKALTGFDIDLIVAPLISELDSPIEWARKQAINFDSIVSIEILGAASDGKYYNMRGMDASEFNSPIDLLFSVAIEQGIYTASIGDGGNEIGMGNIYDLVSKYVPKGDLIGCRVKCQDLITAGVSNWGGYALAASIYIQAIGTSNIEEKMSLILPDIDNEEIYLQLMVDHGAVDGPTCASGMMVDGLDFSYHKGIISKILSYCSDKN